MQIEFCNSRNMNIFGIRYRLTVKKHSLKHKAITAIEGGGGNCPFWPPLDPSLSPTLLFFLYVPATIYTLLLNFCLTDFIMRTLS